MLLMLTGLLASVASGQSSVEGLEDALEKIQERFPQTVSGDELYRAALIGVANHLGDKLGVRENRVLTDVEHKDREAWLEGQRFGFGVEFSTIPGRGMLLTKVFPESPASEAGLLKGDLVVSVNDHPFTGLPTQAILDRVHVERTASSVFDVRRVNGTIGRMKVTKGTYEHPTMWVRRDRDSLVIRVPYFGSGVASLIADALEGWQGAAVVLDLRDNSGGSIDEMVATADLFLDPDAVVVGTATGKDVGHYLLGLEAPKWTNDVAIMMNKGTAGVAEAFVAALQDHGRARVVGTRSAGRGLKTSFYPAGRGLVLEIADTQLSSPSGRSWHGKGLMPDVFVEAQQLSLPVRHAPEPPDLQKDAAIRLISTGGGQR